MTSEATPNPLSEVNLTEVFCKDAELYTEEDIDLIVKTLRAKRELFKVQEAKGKKSKPAAGQMTLDDLDIMGS